MRTVESDENVQNRRLPPLKSTPLRSLGSKHQKWARKYKEQNQSTEKNR